MGSITISIDWKGADRLQAKLDSMSDLSGVHSAVAANGARLQRQAMAKAEFKGHYIKTAEGPKFVKPSGNLKRNIKLGIQDGGLTATVRPEAEYSAYVEYGTRFMAAQPYLRPAFEQVKPQFIADLKKVLKGK